MSFELRDHTADVAVEAAAPSLSALFGAVADGLAAASCDDIPADAGDEFEVSVAAEGVEALLFDYLDQLIYERDVRNVLPTDNDVRVTAPSADADSPEGSTEPADGSGAGAGSTASSRAGVDSPPEPTWRLTGTYRGVPLDAVDAREVKAVTYSEMRVEETDSGWSAYVVFDV